MTLLTLPAPDGTSFAVNPHRVSSVRPYFVVENGLRVEASVVWIDERHVHVCAHRVEQTIALLAESRKTDHDAFAAGDEADKPDGYVVLADRDGRKQIVGPVCQNPERTAGLADRLRRGRHEFWRGATFGVAEVREVQPGNAQR